MIFIAAYSTDWHSSLHNSSHVFGIEFPYILLCRLCTFLVSILYLFQRKTKCTMNEMLSQQVENIT